LLIALMKKQGLAYECAQDGLIALDKYTANPGRYFLLLMDMNMPVMDGFESTAKIRAFERKNSLLAANIAALTGVTSEEARTAAYNAGVNKYLTKPVQMAALKKLIAETRESKKGPEK
jgi:CheY-like chemotaxis protein